MFRSWHVGRAFGIPLYIHPTLLIVPFLAVTRNSVSSLFEGAFIIALIASVFACVVLHELGHALMARYFGIATRDITLYPIGGVARLTRMTERPSEELCIALAGPAVNVAIAALLTPFVVLATAGQLIDAQLALPEWSEGTLVLLSRFVVFLWSANIVLVLFNIVPAFPMDGGRCLRALLAMVVDYVRATDIAGTVGLVIATLFGVYALWSGDLMQVLLACAVAGMGQMERAAVRLRAAHREFANSAAQQRSGYVVEQAAPSGYSGVAWDASHHVWVRWVDGRPVGWWAPAE